VTVGRRRRTARRSRSVIPPQTPCSMRWSRAYARHSVRTRQPVQMALARFCAAPSTKRSSGSPLLHAACSLQLLCVLTTVPSSPRSVPAIPLLSSPGVMAGAGAVVPRRLRPLRTTRWPGGLFLKPPQEAGRQESDLGRPGPRPRGFVGEACFPADARIRPRRVRRRTGPALPLTLPGDFGGRGTAGAADGPSVGDPCISPLRTPTLAPVQRQRR
jgi:hypothetical protein